MNAGDLITQTWDCYWDWEGLLANPRFCRSGRRLAWMGYSGGIIREPITHGKVRSLVESKQLSFQFANGSVFQLLYDFDDREQISAARLAFYQTDLPLGDQEVETSGPTPDFDEVAVSWLRFDYSREHASGVLHCESHLHLSGFPDARFAVSGVPGPRQFVEFVIASCFPDLYRDHRLASGGTYKDRDLPKAVNQPCQPAPSKGAFNQIIHIRVPAQAG